MRFSIKDRGSVEGIDDRQLLALMAAILHNRCDLHDNSAELSVIAARRILQEVNSELPPLKGDE